MIRRKIILNADCGKVLRPIKGDRITIFIAGMHIWAERNA
jgi:hypothetical protein